jgi:bacterioferritin
VAANAEVIKMLNDDLTGEIEAILVYMETHFLMEDEHCPTSLAMFEIALDEMRHVQWLAEKIVALGGDPELTPRKLRFAGRDLQHAVKHGVALEEEAIEQYNRHIAAISDPEVQHMLSHIRDEEQDHRAEFEELVEDVEGGKCCR